MDKYVIDKSHIDQLTAEQRQRLQDLYPPKTGQAIITGKTGKYYTIKRVGKEKVDTGSFKTLKCNVCPALMESDLIHALRYCDISLGNCRDEEGVMSWDVSVNDGCTTEYFESETLVDALWDAFKKELL